MMGTFVEVVSADKQAAPLVFAEIKRIEALLSKYDPQSEISRLNKEGKLKASPQTWYILEKSWEFWVASDGAFDVTVGPLVDLWGFTDKQYRVPKDEEIKTALRRVGMDKISFDERNNVVKFNVPGMEIDLGAIAKGYATDCAAKKLKEAGIKSCLINAGGQIYALGDKFGQPWTIAIRDPRAKSTLSTLELKDQAVSTSGDYEQYFFKGDRRYSHIFNPKTGYPQESGIISVTVIAPDGLTADALSTAIFVLGKDQGQELVKRFPGASAQIFSQEDTLKR
jgi:thiamine biosynthesis lipoprotein